MNITTTIAPFGDIPVLLENGWHLVVFSEAEQKAVMYSYGAWKLDPDTKLPEVLEPKKGQDGAGKPAPVEPAPVEPEPEIKARQSIGRFLEEILDFEPGPPRP